jgi:hypothetical protein
MVRIAYKRRLGGKIPVPRTSGVDTSQTTPFAVPQAPIPPTCLTNLTLIVWPDQSESAYVIDQPNPRPQVKIGRSLATLQPTKSGENGMGSE